MGVVCAPTDEEAEYVGSTYRAMGRRLRLGVRGPLPAPEEALRELAEGPSRPFEREGEWPRLFVGGPDKVRAELTAMAQALGLDEIMAVTITHEHATRVRSLRASGRGLRPHARED
ncbi:MAG: hypothetical protein WDM92_11060 [Caulobacteraceae bacterium]